MADAVPGIPHHGIFFTAGQDTAGSYGHDPVAAAGADADEE